MAGPSATVLVEFERHRPTWRDLMTPFASHLDGGSACWVSDTRSFGGSYVGEPRPFVGSVGPFEFDPQEWPDDAAISNAICRFTDRRFTNAIVVAAMCNRPDDHRVLCEVVAALAEQVDGLIDFDALDVPADSGLSGCRWTFDSEEQSTIIGTPAAARQWLRHPAFRMLK